MIVGTIDLALVSLYIFWLFFAGLLFYLQRESRREGYPLVEELDGSEIEHGIFMPGPKEFLLSDGSVAVVPDKDKDRQPINMEQTIPGLGSPGVPIGDPMLAGVGPGAYTPRANRPDLLFEGGVRIVPMRTATDFYLEEKDPDPRGMAVLGADGEQAGTVSDVWVDRAEFVARYFEVELSGAAGLAAGDDEGVSMARRVLLPVNFTQIDGSANTITVNAILGSHFENVPATADADLVTLDEEDRICAYYGAGYLYATPMRQEAYL